MLRIILTRHGETLWNIEGKVQGISDSPLSENGLKQTENLAERLLIEKIDTIYSSDLPRAYHTAKIIQNKLSLPPVILTPFLREVSFGKWEGKSWRELRQLYPDIFTVWDQEPHRAVIPGGDNWEHAANETYNFLQTILEKHEDQTICLVSHGLTLKLLITKVLGYEISEWKKTPWQYNTALNIVEYRDGIYFPLLLGNCEHLS